LASLLLIIFKVNAALVILCIALTGFCYNLFKYKSGGKNK
jgi:hypothetical protein